MNKDTTNIKSKSSMGEDAAKLSEKEARQRLKSKSAKPVTKVQPGDEEEAAKNKSASIIIGCIAAAVIIAVVLIAIFSGKGPGPAETIEKFYNAVYLQDGGGIPAIQECCVSEKEYDIEMSYTMGGTTDNYCMNYRELAKTTFGQDYEISTEVISEEYLNSTSLAIYKDQYANVSSGKIITFAVHFSGSITSQSFSISTVMVKQDGMWKMISYSDIPVGDPIYISYDF